MGAVWVSRAGVLRQRSVLGGAERVNEPIHSGMESIGRFKAMKEPPLGDGMAKVSKMMSRYSCFQVAGGSL